MVVSCKIYSFFFISILPFSFNSASENLLKVREVKYLHRYYLRPSTCTQSMCVGGKAFLSTLQLYACFGVRYSRQGTMLA